MEQAALDFSAKAFGTEPRKLSRATSPDTSLHAAAKVDTTKLEELVYEAICRYGARGCISDDVLSCFPNLPYSSVTARYRALLDKGFIEDTGERRPGRSGRPQRVVRRAAH